MKICINIILVQWKEQEEEEEEDHEKIHSTNGIGPFSLESKKSHSQRFFAKHTTQRERESRALVQNRLK